MVFKKIRDKLAGYKSKITEGLSYAGCPKTKEGIKKSIGYISGGAAGGTAGGYLLSNFGEKIAEGAGSTIKAVYNSLSHKAGYAKSIGETVGTGAKDALTYTITVNPLILGATFLGGMATDEGIRMARKQLKKYKALHPKIKEVAKMLGGKQGEKLAESYHSSFVNAVDRLNGYISKIKKLENENKCLEGDIKRLYKTEHPDIANKEAQKYKEILKRNSNMIDSYIASIKEIGRVVEDRQNKLNEVMKRVYDVIEGKSNKLVTYEDLVRRKEIDIKDVLKDGEEYLKNRSKETAEKMAELAIEIGKTKDRKERKKLQAEYKVLQRKLEELPYENMRFGAAERLIGHPKEKKGILNRLKDLKKRLESTYKSKESNKSV